jgi:hypothetical protein
MGNGQVEALQRLIRDREELEMHREAEARAIAHRLIQTHIGQYRRGIDIPKFYAALAEALMATRAQAQSDGLGEEVLTLTGRQGARASGAL